MPTPAERLRQLAREYEVETPEQCEAVLRLDAEGVERLYLIAHGQRKEGQSKSSQARRRLALNRHAGESGIRQPVPARSAAGAP